MHQEIQIETIKEEKTRLIREKKSEQESLIVSLKKELSTLFPYSFTGQPRSAVAYRIAKISREISNLERFWRLDDSAIDFVLANTHYDNYDNGYFFRRS